MALRAARTRAVRHMTPYGRAVGSGGGCQLDAGVDTEAVVHHVHSNRTAVGQRPRDEQVRDAVVHLTLDEPTQRTGTVLRLVAVLAEPGDGGLRHLEADLTTRQPLRRRLQHEA